MGDDGPVAVGVAGDPVGHVAAVRAAHERRPRRVQVRPPGERRVHGRRDVLVRRAAPVVPAAVDHPLAVPGGERRVRHEHRVAAGREEVRVPAPVPAVPRAERAAVNPDDERRGVLRRGVRRPHEPAPDLGAVARRGPSAARRRPAQRSPARRCRSPVPPAPGRPSVRPGEQSVAAHRPWRRARRRSSRPGSGRGRRGRPRPSSRVTRPSARSTRKAA